MHSKHSLSITQEERIKADSEYIRYLKSQYFGGIIFYLNEVENKRSYELITGNGIPFRIIVSDTKATFLYPDMRNSSKYSLCLFNSHSYVGYMVRLFSVDDDKTLRYYKSIGINIKAVKGKFSTKEERNNWRIENTKKAVEDMAFYRYTAYAPCCLLRLIKSDKLTFKTNRVYAQSATMIITASMQICVISENGNISLYI